MIEAYKINRSGRIKWLRHIKYIEVTESND